MLPYLFGLGGLLFVLCSGLEREAAASDRAALQGVASCLLFGVLVNHVLALLLPGIGASLCAGAALSVVGILALTAAKRALVARLFPAAWLVPFLVLYGACLYLVAGEPVSGWDARSIWFLHGKMLFYHGSVDAGGQWRLPSLVFSHTDYPLLVPILAAQIATVAGYWNEYLPKLSLVALLWPALLLLLSILGAKWRHALFLCVPLLFLGTWLTNGYMDGYLALYAGLGCFYLGRWLDRGRRLDLVTGLLSAGIVLDLKNEGMLYVLILSALLCLFLLVSRLGLTHLKGGMWRGGAIIVAVMASGWMLWERKKHLFQLHNDLRLGPESVERVLQRLSDGSLAVVLKYLYVVDNVNLSLGVFLLALVVTARHKERPRRGALFCAAVALIYFAGIVTIYLATPFDLVTFHLPTGDRTMLPVHIMLLAASFSLFDSAEATSALS
ncbi:hypothetical protein JFN91_14690 [Geomonas sp. Red421]|uniref:Glycosyltransferase RgtA/B/C/D-like domain-containing protein n=2 Tax=Geomonas anaerohicana TaxID=2798583 RepID=A0ABS0YGK5_9BACT|nr:hypothetical protein [Geomonas anaerohicana]